MPTSNGENETDAASTTAFTQTALGAPAAGRATARRRKLLRDTPIVKLLDVEILQQLQDWLAETYKVSVIVRDLEGLPVTRPSGQNAFCGIVMAREAGAANCQASNRKAVKRAAEERRVVKYVCHAGLTQFAAPIELEGICVGTIVMGDRPEGRISPDHIAALADRIGAEPAALTNALQTVERWSDEDVRSAVTFLLSIANAVAAICYQGVELRARLDEISSLYEVSKSLAGTLSLREVLDIVAKGATKVIGAKGCSIRLLDKNHKRLEVKSYYKLSRRYMDKGPLLVSRSPIDRAALAGELVQLPDMLNDKRIIYPKEAEREGIRSGMSVGLISKNRAIGTLHLYSSEPRQLDASEEQVIRSLANQAAIAIENAQLYQESLQKRKLDRELRVAGEIQERLLPEQPPEIPGFRIAAASVPCSDVGGDFYDFVPLDEKRMALIIADVAGKGVPGALLMASARAGLRAHLESVRDPQEAVQRLNVNLHNDTRAGQFVSLFCSVLDHRAGILRYTNAGHNPPLLARDGTLTELTQGGLVLGADGDEVYDEDTVVLQSGDVVLFFTDGVSEALNADQDVFGEPRLQEIVRNHKSTDVHALLETILTAVREFVAGEPQSDDITLVALGVE